MKQSTTPVLISRGTTRNLEKIDLLDNAAYNEDWIQSLVFEHPKLIPIEEIEPAYANPIAVCKELPTKSGFCDLILVNSMGYVSIVECKLWRNPEARRAVLSQIIEYAKDLSQWSYEQFQQSCLKARRNSDSSLFEIVQSYYPEADEQLFIDSVQRNLTSARIMLAVVGDGIRENAEELTDFLQSYGNLSFSLALIELPLYRLGNNGDLVVTPRVVAKTTEIIRSIIRIENDRNVQVTQPLELRQAQTGSESVFYERLAAARDNSTVAALRSLVVELQEQLGIVAKMGRGNRLSMNLKSADDGLNFASIQEDGQVWFYGIVDKAEKLGQRQIGLDYLSELAAIVGGEVDTSTQEWNWSVRRRGKYLFVDSYLEKREAFVELLTRTLSRIDQISQ